MRRLTTFDRRTLLKALAAAPLTIALPVSARAAAAQVGLMSTRVCMLSAEVTEGPFYLEPHLIRANITEGRPGLPMRLKLQVVRADCTPVSGARVDVWHCDAQGRYSGVKNLGGGQDTTGQTFLRGTQNTASDGVAGFLTIFPGWYPGRTTHVHYKVFLDERTVLTGQIFFDETVNQTVYDNDPAYARPDKRDSLNATDGIAAKAGKGAYAKVTGTEPGETLEASLVVGINPKADTVRGGILHLL